jgi:hypothetical protein
VVLLFDVGSVAGQDASVVEDVLDFVAIGDNLGCGCHSDEFIIK